MFGLLGLARCGTVLGTLGVLLLTACDGPAPPSPPIMPPQQWRDDLAAGNLDSLILSTTETIDEGEEAEFYAEALLFRGAARLQLGEIEIGLEDLLQAEERQDQLRTIDLTGETLLLYRALMITYARLEDMESAERYRSLAVELAPEQESVIQEEFDHQELNLEVLP